MTDIVYRLRALRERHSYLDWVELLAEAAAEIERLRARIDVLESRELDHYTELEDQLERAHMSLVPEGMVLVPLTELEAQRVPGRIALLSDVPIHVQEESMGSVRAAYRAGWNDCREAMVAAAPQPAPTTPTGGESDE